MQLFGHKAKRPTRSQSQLGPESAIARWSRLLRRRGVLLRLMLCLVTLLLLLLVTQSWRAPFPYRVRDYVPRGIAARFPFQQINEDETRRQRERAEDLEPLRFRNDPEPLRTLPAELRAALGEIAQSTQLSDLPDATAAAFNLHPDADSDRPTANPDEVQSPEEHYAALKNAVSPKVGQITTEQRINDIVDEFTKFIDPLLQYGVIDPTEIRRHSIRSNRLIRILPAQPGSQPDLVDDGAEKLVAEVRLSDALELGQSWLLYPGLAPEIQPALKDWLTHQIIGLDRTTLQYDQEATDQALQDVREAVPDVIDVYRKGDLLVEPGAQIDLRSMALLQTEYETAEAEVTPIARLLRIVIAFLMVLVLAVLIGFHMIRNEPMVVRSLSRLAVYLAAVVLAVGLSRLMSFDPARAEMVPLLVVVMILAIAYNQVFATITAFVLCLVSVLSTTMGLGDFVVTMSAAAAAVMPLSRVASRKTLIKVGLLSGVTYFLVSCSVGIIETQSISEVFRDTSLLVFAAKGAGWCMGAALLVMGILPYIESRLGVVTDISLLELSDPSHPLLQELVRRAPGTYNHSIAVATISETAAEAIGANGLLVRVGAYFHDIGKMLKPEYFIENIQAGAINRHEQLNPAMSTLIIIGHVKDGVDLAEQHNLPQPLIDFIEQHHGTTLVEYFFHAATKQAEDNPDHRTDAEESTFRYPGPKPQTREAGVMMLSDAVESASRSLVEPTPKRIETLVNKIVMKKLLDGQFDECSLTLSEIRIVERSLVKSLISIYHGRIKYPEVRADR